MFSITDEHTFTAYDLTRPVKVLTSSTQQGECFYLLNLRGEYIDEELTTEEARALRDALSRALQFQSCH